MSLGVFLAICFTLFIMHKATTTFSDADGTTTIAIFFFQLIALMFRDRAAHLATPIMMDLLAVMELSFVTNSERTCMVKLTFYDNYYFNIVSTLAIVLTVYMIIIGITSLTSSNKQTQKDVMMTDQKAKSVKAAVHILQHVHVFETLEPASREAIATAMVRSHRTMPHMCFGSPDRLDTFCRLVQRCKSDMKVGESVMKEGDTEKFFIVLKGSVDVEHLEKKVATIRVGQHFGVEALFHKRPASCTVTSAAPGTEVMTLTRKAFRTCRKGFNEQAQQSMEYNIHHHHDEGQHDDIIKHSEEHEHPDSQVATDAPAPQEDGQDSSEGAATRQRPSESSSPKSPKDLDETLVDPTAGDGDFDFSKQYESAASSTRESHRHIQRSVEAEELAERIMIVQFQRAHRKEELLRTEVEVHACCNGPITLLEPIGIEISRLYGATLNPTARYCGILEAMIALYGPLTLAAMSVLFCRDVIGVTPDGKREVKTVLVVDSTKECSGEQYDTAKMFGICTLVVFCAGVPLIMWYAANSFYMMLSNSGNHEEAKALAKARYHSSWKIMDKKERHHIINGCAHEIRQQIMGQNSFLLSTFQMCVEKRHAYWYPQWHLLRRTFLNYLYFDGLRSGDNTTGVFVFARYDWRVVIALVLVASNVLQQYAQPFRDKREDQLEAWSLNLLTMVVVVDIADDTNSIYACLVVSLGFAVMVAHQMWKDRTMGSVSESQWHNLRRLQVETGQIEGDGVEHEKSTLSMLRIKMAEAEKKVKQILAAPTNATPCPVLLTTLLLQPQL
jgi:hypothetical protein